MRIRRALTPLSLVATGLFAALSLAVGGAPPASAAGGNATLTFVHGIHDSGPLDVWVNGVLTASDLTYPSVSSPQSFPPGSYNIAVRTAGSPQSAPPYIVPSPFVENLSAGQNATVVLNEDGGGNHVVNSFTNPTATTPAGDATVIVRNTAQPTATAVDVWNGQTQIASGLAYLDQASVNLPAGTVQLSIVPHPSSGPSSTLFPTTTLSLTAGHVYIVYAVGTQASHSLMTTVQSYAVGETFTGNGYVMAGSDGAAYTFGSAAYAGSLPGLGVHVNNVVGVGETADGGGYWMVASDGGIFNFGDAGFYGSAGAIHLNKPIVGMAATPDGHGYWLVASDGGIFTYGDAQFYGSTGAIQLNKPVVGMAATPDGGGYWLVASDGGIFSYGDAQFYGSTGAIHLNKPIVGIHASADGNGYVMVASDGGIFDYGDAPYFGSLPGLGVQVGNIVGISGGATGYSFFGSNGAVYSFGGATYAGSLPGLGVSVNNVVGGAVS
jgi:Domain of unknown function (DUF4397)